MYRNECKCGPNNRQLKDDDAAANGLQSVCESVSLWAVSGAQIGFGGEYDLVKGTGNW
jgi:hypothetical protein